MEVSNFFNIIDKYFVYIAIILYISAYAPFIYKIFKHKNVNQKFKKEYYFLLVIAFLMVFVHSVIHSRYEIVLYCIIKIIIVSLIVYGKIMYP